MSKPYINLYGDETKNIITRRALRERLITDLFVDNWGQPLSFAPSQLRRTAGGTRSKRAWSNGFRWMTSFIPRCLLIQEPNIPRPNKEVQEPKYLQNKILPRRTSSKIYTLDVSIHTYHGDIQVGVVRKASRSATGTTRLVSRTIK